jgi:hypothetical protein
MSNPLPWYYAVNDRPVKCVPTADGGMSVVALDMRTGEFVPEPGYLSRVLAHDSDVDQLTEDEFSTLLRAKLAEIGR